MKNLVLFFLIAFNVNAMAQNAGEVGELLENDLEKEDVVLNDAKAALGINKNPVTGHRGVHRNNSFRWNYNYGDAEVFIRIPESGRFTVEVNEQIMTNSVGKFRFFDLRAGIVTIAIYDDAYLLYRTNINLNRNTRTVLDFFTNEGLYLLGVFPQAPKNYGINEWDDVWNSIYNHPQLPHQWSHSYGVDILQPEEFDVYLNALKKEAFDEDKINFILSSAKRLVFTSSQVKEMIEMFSFDDNKLEVLKQLYPKVVDPKNFFMIYDALSFDSTKEKLKEYIINSY